jgi:signal transduction histidine kinase
MRAGDFPFWADWVAISLRWLVLIGIVSSLAIGGVLELPLAGIPLLLALWNIIVSTLAMLNRRVLAHRLINIIVDVTAVIVIFTMTQWFDGFNTWCLFWPLVTGAIYFEITGAVLIGIGISILLSVSAYISGDLYRLLTPLGITFAANLILGSFLGLISRRLVDTTRRIYHANLRQRKEVARKARQQERSRLQKFYEMIETLSVTLNYEVVLETALELSLNVLEVTDEPGGKVQTISAFLLFGEDNKLVVSAAQGFSQQDCQETFEANQGVLENVLRRAESKLIEEPANDPELGRLLGLQKCKVALCLPLMRGLNAYGVLLFAHPKPTYFDLDRIELLKMASYQSAIAIQNARLFQNLEEEKERIVATQEETRKKLARDLHDGPTQSVSSIAMRVNVVRYILDKDREKAISELEGIEDLARRTTQEIRHMLFTLRPLILESEGLIAALQANADKMKETFQQNVEIDVDPRVVEQLEMGKQTVIFYLSEEAVNNARKHAEASQVLVRLRFLPKDERVVLLEIIDNGIGFDVAAVASSYESRGSLGMVNLQERADLISGLLQLDSVVGKGTRIRVYIPLNREAIDLLQRGKEVQ